MPKVSHYNDLLLCEIYEMLVYKHTETIDYVKK